MPSLRVPGSALQLPGLLNLEKGLSISFDKKLWFLFWTERGSNLGVLAHWTSLLMKSTAVLLKAVEISREEGFSLPRKGSPSLKGTCSQRFPSFQPIPASWLGRMMLTGQSQVILKIKKKYWFGGMNQREKYSTWDFNHSIFLFPMHLPYISTYRKSYHCY